MTPEKQVKQIKPETRGHEDRQHFWLSRLLTAPQPALYFLSRSTPWDVDPAPLSPLPPRSPRFSVVAEYPSCL